MRDAERFWTKVEQGDGCWRFTGTLREDGYRQLGVGSLTDGSRRNVLAHRYSYELAHGAIPAGLTVDHECHNLDRSCAGGPSCPHRSCIRPDHLVARLIGDNVRRARPPKLRCPQDHLYDEANTRTLPNGQRRCRACDRDRARARRATARAVASLA